MHHALSSDPRSYSDSIDTFTPLHTTVNCTWVHAPKKVAIVLRQLPELTASVMQLNLFTSFPFWSTTYSDESI